jgi:hypothetical protein
MPEETTTRSPKIRVHWKLRRRLLLAYDNAYFGYVAARELRCEPDMLWWGERVVRIRVLLSGDESSGKVTPDLVAGMERELCDRRPKF